MLRLVIACLFALLYSYSNAQNEQAFAPERPKPELTSSTPMPRVNEPFFVSINIKKLRENMFESMAPNIKNAKVTNNGAAELQLLSITPEKTGPLEIGPVEYVVNNIKYTTNKLVVQVAEELPFTDTGLWISKVPVNDKEFCIIIEQRAPIQSVTTKVGTTWHTNYNSHLDYEKSVRFDYTIHIEGLSEPSSSSNSGMKSFFNNGKKTEYMSVYTVSRFHITDPKAKIKITKDHLENLPAGYVFNEIIVQ